MQITILTATQIIHPTNHTHILKQCHNNIIIYTTIFLCTHLLTYIIIMYTHTHTQIPVLHKMKSRLKREFQKYGGTAELKILIVLCYYIIFTVVSLTSFSIISKHIPKLRDDLTQYFACESRGVSSEMDCQREVDRIDSEIALTLAYVLIGFFPYVNIIYIVSSNDVRRFWARIRGIVGVTSVSKNASGTSATKRSME